MQRRAAGPTAGAEQAAHILSVYYLSTRRLFDDQTCTAAAVVPTVCQLTGLRELALGCISITEEGLILLQLTQLTVLEYTGPLDGNHTSMRLTRKASLMLINCMFACL